MRRRTSELKGWMVRSTGCRSNVLCTPEIADVLEQHGGADHQGRAGRTNIKPTVPGPGAARRRGASEALAAG
jgi:hypothetical protein